MTDTTQIEPLPVRWQDELFAVLVFAVVLVFLGSAIVSLVTGDGAQAFLIAVGGALASSVIEVLLGFAGTVAFAFGVSLGGQLIVRDHDARGRIRRTTGGVVQLLMVTSVLLLAGQGADAATHPSRLGALVATVPLVVTTLAFGCHVAGLNVPRYDRQLEAATRGLAVRRAQKNQLPPQWTRSRGRIVAAIGLHVTIGVVLASAISILCGANVQQTVPVAIAVATATCAVGCFTLATPAAALTAPGRRQRVAARTWPIVAMTFVATFAWAGSAVLAPRAAIPLAVLHAAILALGVAAVFPLPAVVPRPLARWTLNGITARSARVEVLRSIRQVEARLRSLDDHGARSTESR